MRLNSKLMWGLGWAGLALVVAVPSADFVTGLFAGPGKALLTSTTEPVKTSGVTTTVTPDGIKITPTTVTTTATADPVDQYLKSNKTLPSYLSDGASGTVAPKAPVAAPTQVATLEPKPETVAPMPYPSWARPHDSLPKTTTATAAPAPKAPAQSPALIVDENTLAIEQQQAAVAPSQTYAPAPVTTLRSPVPPAPIVDDTANWRTAGLGQYLEDNGLLDDGSTRSTANVTVQAAPQSDYDPDGFYLSDGPNAQSARAAQRRARLRQLFEDDQYGDYPDFVSF
ncbi:MAG: hypothetical protein ABI697_04205 [Devosia sp.]